LVGRREVIDGLSTSSRTSGVDVRFGSKADSILLRFVVIVIVVAIILFAHLAAAHELSVNELAFEIGFEKRSGNIGAK
jgi:hypothetical protein